MLKADYKLTRGAFKFGKNQHPVQDWYAMKVEKDPSGAIVLKWIVTPSSRQRAWRISSNRRRDIAE